MFDFSLVGIGVAVAGILFISLIGWRLIPKRRSKGSENQIFDIARYITEVNVPENSSILDKQLREINSFLNTSINVLGILRGTERFLEPSSLTRIRMADILIVQADTENLKALIAKSGVKLVGSKQLEQKDLESDSVRLVETVVSPYSVMVGSTARSLNLRANYGVNLLAISSQGAFLGNRMDKIRFRTGDVLLIQSHVETMREVMASLWVITFSGKRFHLTSLVQLS